VGPDGVQSPLRALTLKAHSKGEHLLRFEAIAHNTRQLACGRVPGKFPEIVTRLAGMAGQFWTLSGT